MSFKTTLALALAAAAVLPASAAAQERIEPPEGDHYLFPVPLSSFSDPAPFPRQEIGFIADTTNYTVQEDMYNPAPDANGNPIPSSGGPEEPNNCGTGTFGNTIWSVFYSDRHGLMRVTTAGTFDAVVGIVPFKSPTEDITPLGYDCDDRLAGLSEEFEFFTVPKQWYAVQVGGIGNPRGGTVQVKYDLQPSPRVDGDAVLTWNTHPRGAKVKSLVVSAPKGAKIAISCTRRGCRPPRAFTVKKPLLRKLGPVGPSAGGSGLRMSAADGGASPVGDASSAAPARRTLKADTSVHAAKKYTLLRRQVLKAGSKLIIRVTRPGHVGRYFSYPVTRKGVSAKTTRCMRPGSTTPRKRC
jgi:hypothetical protein